MTRLPHFIPATACRPVLSLHLFLDYRSWLRVNKISTKQQAGLGGVACPINPSWPPWSLSFFSAAFLFSLMNSWHSDLRRLANGPCSPYTLATMSPLMNREPTRCFPENPMHPPLQPSQKCFPHPRLTSSCAPGVCGSLCCLPGLSHRCSHSIAISKHLPRTCHRRPSCELGRQKWKK